MRQLNQLRDGREEGVNGAALAILWVITLVLIVMWDQNTVSIVAAALGITATLLSVFKLRWWRGVGATASALFLINWALAFIRLGGDAPLEAYASVIENAFSSARTIDAAVVLGYEAALPALHLIASVALVVSIISSRRES